MQKTKQKSKALAQPIAADKWAKRKEAERLRYTTPPPAPNWKTAEKYTCPELHHRSMNNQPPSLVLGSRVTY